ncbi:MAG TPA: DUF4468 domain-containing protein [Cyclobacteriaceae bacterium]|jgi:hypothetical protein|nr:DUF4468 domain-containing protein [Cyclobacteriaceae bacterium]
MMNPKIIIVVFLILIKSAVYGQVSFPLNASGKIEISDVVIDSLKKEDLYARASSWFESLPKTPGIKLNAINEDPINGNISGDLEFLVYYQSGILQKVLGSVTYKLTLGVKDNKYRYTYTDFVFHYYKQNRNYQTVPTGKVKPLEDAKASGWQKNWNKCKVATNTKVTNQINAIKAKMTKAVAPAVSATKTEQKKLDW